MMSWMVKALNVLGTLTGTMPFVVYTQPTLRLVRSRMKMTWTAILAILTMGQFCLTFYLSMFTIPVQVGGDGYSYSNYSDATLPAIINQTDPQLAFFKIINPAIVFNMGFMSHLVAMFSLRRRLPLFVIKLTAIDKKLTRLIHTDKTPSTNEITLAPRPIAVALFLFALFLPLPVFGYYISTAYAQLYSGIWVVFMVFLNTVTFSIELQLIMFCIFLGDRFKVINLQLRADNQQKLLNQTWFHPKDSFFSRVNGLSVHKIQLTQECFLKLCDLAGLLNDIYSVQMVVSMSGCFLKSLLNIYFVFFGAHSLSSVKSETRQLSILRTLLWMLHYSGRFFSLAMAASYPSQQANRTKCVLMTMLNRHLETSIKQCLITFWKNSMSRTLEFSACGLFTVKSTMILGASSTILTYFFILVQYRLQIEFP